MGGGGVQLPREDAFCDAEGKEEHTEAGEPEDPGRRLEKRTYTPSTINPHLRGF